MNQSLPLSLDLALAAAAGVLLGAVFFGGLWWTLRRAFASPRPALWVGGSLLLRMAWAVGGFVSVASGDWRRLLACLLGFWAARWGVVRLSALLSATQPPPAPHTSSAVATQCCAEANPGST